MEKLTKLTIVVVLTLMLATSALAGDIGIPVVPPPPPAASSVLTTPGEMQIPGNTGTPTASSDSMTELALNLLQTVLSIF
jgi:hypothetical protein